MTLLEFVILALACWRISYMLVWERGPFDVLLRLRTCFGIKHDETGRPYEYPDGLFPQLFSCVWCVSVWVAFMLIAFWLPFPSITIVVAAIPALSGAAIVINHLVSDV